MELKIVSSHTETAGKKQRKRMRLRELNELLWMLPAKQRKHIVKIVYEAEKLRESATISVIQRRLATPR